jgi:hypothetical protein
MPSYWLPYIELFIEGYRLRVVDARLLSSGLEGGLPGILRLPPAFIIHGA